MLSADAPAVRRAAWWPRRSCCRSSKAAAHRADAQPGRSRHPLLRPLPELLHPRHRADALARAAAGPRRRRARRAQAGTGTGVLVVGYGNPLRTDDGVGWHAARLLAADPRLADAQVLARHQLAPELAADVSRASLVVLVDANADGDPGSVTVGQVRPEPATSASWSHHLTPEALAGLAETLYGPVPPDRPGERRRRLVRRGRPPLKRPGRGAARACRGGRRGRRRRADGPGERGVGGPTASEGSERRLE
jgi:hydrogenase maturation protease